VEIEHREAVERAARKAARSTAIKAATGYFLLIFILLIGAWIYQRHTDEIIKTSLQGSCKRVNTLRVQEDNRNAQVVWAALYRSYQREASLADMGNDARTHRLSADYLKKSVDALRWVPQTDCDAAVKNPDTYVPPTPRKFDVSFLDFDKVPK
jgi:hypothetical protein